MRWETLCQFRRRTEKCLKMFQISVESRCETKIILALLWIISNFNAFHNFCRTTTKALPLSKRTDLFYFKLCTLSFSQVIFYKLQPLYFNDHLCCSQQSLYMYNCWSSESARHHLMRKFVCSKKQTTGDKNQLPFIVPQNAPFRIRAILVEAVIPSAQWMLFFFFKVAIPRKNSREIWKFRAFKSQIFAAFRDSVDK